MNDKERLEESILNLLSDIDSLRIEMRELKKINDELSKKLYLVNEKLDTL